jgi:hypothetical protein
MHEYVYFNHIYPHHLLLSPFSILLLPRPQAALLYTLFLGLGSAYERKHVLFVFLSLISLNIMISSSIHFPEWQLTLLLAE